jgi:UTP--glucose-1-phosphate uridylyltransferase
VKDKIKKVIIPVAGLGTRFLPATKAQPKEMLPIIDKPIIQFLVEEAVGAGAEDIIFVTGRGKRAIEDHFDFAPELESVLLSNNKKDAFDEVRAISRMANFSYVRQNLPIGDGDAILRAEHLVGNDPVGVLFGDDIVDNKVSCFSQMQEVYKKHKGVILALDVVPKKDVSRYGVVKAKKIGENIFKIEDVVEKPKVEDAPSNIVIVGKYIIIPEIFNELREIKKNKKSGEIRLADALKIYLKKAPVYGMIFKGKRYDCGSKIGFLKATVDFALKHSAVKKDFKKYIKNISKNL